MPLGVQLAQTLEAAIRAEELGPGDKLPSVRQMAALAGVNVNTVRTVYGRLEQQGLLSSEHGRGTFVRGAMPDAASDPAAELMSIRDGLHGHVQRLRRDEEQRLQLIAADKAAIEEQEAVERAQEVQTAGRRSRGTAATPPRVDSGPGAWVLKWRG